MQLLLFLLSLFTLLASSALAQFDDFGDDDSFGVGGFNGIDGFGGGDSCESSLFLHFFLEARLSGGLNFSQSSMPLTLSKARRVKMESTTFKLGLKSKVKVILNLERRRF